MTSVQIKNVPDETLEVLKRRAEGANQSLQEYLLAKLIAEARQATLEEVLDRAARRPKTSISVEQINTVIRDLRDSR